MWGRFFNGNVRNQVWRESSGRFGVGRVNREMIKAVSLVAYFKEHNELLDMY